MLLRSINQHVKEQNWFAVGLDFVIVIIGVFIGIQVSNWNDSRVSAERETELLIELRREIEASISTTNQKSYAIGQVAAAGARSLRFLASGEACSSNCWLTLVDFFHASQWQGIDVRQSTYEEMRRDGLPRSREIIDAVERYLATNANLSGTWKIPEYRSAVRRHIPVDVQSYYWKTCYDLTGGAETYVLDCPNGVAADVSKQAVDAIVENSEIQLFLTEWTGLAASTPPDMGEQNKAAKLAIATIDLEIERRR